MQYMITAQQQIKLNKQNHLNLCSVKQQETIEKNKLVNSVMIWIQIHLLTTQRKIKKTSLHVHFSIPNITMNWRNLKKNGKPNPSLQ